MFKSKDKEKIKKDRFEVTYEQNQFTEGYKIIVDKQTGVNYLVSYLGNGSGVVPLLGADGKPVITPIIDNF